MSSVGSLKDQDAKKKKKKSWVSTNGLLKEHFVLTAWCLLIIRHENGKAAWTRCDQSLPPLCCYFTVSGLWGESRHCTAYLILSPSTAPHPSISADWPHTALIGCQFSYIRWLIFSLSGKQQTGFSSKLRFTASFLFIICCLQSCSLTYSFFSTFYPLVSCLFYNQHGLYHVRSYWYNSRFYMKWPEI